MITPLAFLAIAVTVPSDEPVVTTIAAVHASPEQYAGQLIRLRGWINRCRPLSCSISERPAETFRDQGRRLSIAADANFDRLVREKTPVHVVIDAAFSSVCMKDEVCLDRAPQLTIVRAALDPSGDTLPTRD